MVLDGAVELVFPGSVPGITGPPDIAFSLPSNICSVGPPSERVGTWWLPDAETVHYVSGSSCLPLSV